jgi:hypothetical protein
VLAALSISHGKRIADVRFGSKADNARCQAESECHAGARKRTLGERVGISALCQNWKSGNKERAARRHC